MQPIVCFVESHAKRTPRKVAIVNGDTQTTYEELWRLIKVAAAWYVDNGDRAADTVLISTDSRDPFFVPAYFGAHLARAIAVPIGFRASSDEVERRKQLVESRLSLTDEKLSELHAVLSNSGSTANSSKRFDRPSESDVAEIVFTTGSVGESKGVTLSHRNIAASAALIQEFVGNTDDDTEVVTVPLTHSFGLGRLRATMLAGGTIVFVPGLTFPQLTIVALQEHAATGLVCVPTGICLLMAKFGDSLAALSGQLRYIELGSAPLSVDDKEILCRLLPDTRLCMHYGLTEASRSTFLEFHADRDHLDSIGKPSPGVEVKIVNRRDSLGSNKGIGLIHMRAATVMQGYWNDDERTKTVLDPDSGWLNSYDLGYIDDGGYVHLAGRADDQINSGGVTLLPEDVERFACGFNGVVDCGCVGIPDPDGLLGEIPLIYIVVGSMVIDSQEFSNYLRKRFGLQMPKFLVRLTDRLPRTESGKLLRRELRAMFEDTSAKPD